MALLIQERAVALMFGAYLCFVFIGSRPYQNLLIADSSGETDVFRQLAVFGLCILAALVFLVERHRSRVSILMLLYTLVFCGFLLLSSRWSQFPEFVIRRAGMVTLVSVSLCVLIDYLYRTRLLLPTLVAVLGVVLLIDVLSMVFLYSQSIDHDGRWKGIHIHKNVAGGIMAVSAITFAWLTTLCQRRQSVFTALATIVSLVFLVLTASKTSLALFAGCSALMFLLLTLRLLHSLGGLKALIIVLAAVVLVIATVDMPRALIGLLKLFYGDVTLTGRIWIWDFVLAKHNEAFWLGHGFGSFWGMGADTPAIREDLPSVREFGQAHNGYLDILVQTGVVGLCFFGVMLLYVVGLGIKRVVSDVSDWKKVALCVNIILFVMLHNLLESTWLSVLSVEWTVFIIAAFYLVLDRPQSTNAS
ncbi:O-antigen ligase family protein [Granulosicoccus antarcticus]|uniref:O-antigen ligase family protein n=1 Tax=Granulosicoccus antarcticus TaxID=437505 RepID=UPI0012FE2EA9|nr:O-antigen ligase family protein [Granulosicoccus antarcticus]